MLAMHSIGRCLARQVRILLPHNVQIMCKSTVSPLPVEEENSTDADKPKPEFEEPQPVSERMAEFQRKLRENKAKLNEFSTLSQVEKELLKPWPNNTNPHTGEIGGPRGPEPTRYGDWQYKGRVTDF